MNRRIFGVTRNVSIAATCALSLAGSAAPALARHSHHEARHSHHEARHPHAAPGFWESLLSALAPAAQSPQAQTARPHSRRIASSRRERRHVADRDAPEAGSDSKPAGASGSVGIASYYRGRGSMTAAHRSLPFGTHVRVTNLSNGRSAVVVINDRGPFIRGRVIDLSYGAASAVGMTGRGIARVRLDVQ